MISAYFDESAEEHVGQGYLAVAGYVFLGSGLSDLNREWKVLLKTYKLPYFHMAECNVDNPQPPNVFAHLTKPERIEAATHAMRIAREHPLHGAAYVVRQEEYRAILESDGFDCDAYSFLLWTALLQAAKWCTNNKPRHYLNLHFEKGYKSQPRANELLNFVIGDDAVWRRNGRPRVIRHSFFEKERSYPGQSADLLAWHVRKGNANLAAGKPVRRDTLALLKDQSIQTIHYTAERLLSIKDEFIEKSGTLARASQILFTPNDPFVGEV